MKKYIFALLVVVVMFNAFDNLKEITNLAIVSVLGLDVDEEGNYIATVEIIAGDKENNKKTILEKATGNSIQEAIRNIIDKTPQRLYLAHLETLIVSEDIAKSGIDNIVDFFIRDNDASNNFYLFVSKEKTAGEVIEKISEQEVSMLEMLKSSEKYRGNANTKTLSQCIQQILKVGSDICVNSCGINEDEIYIGEMAYFKEWKMQGYMSKDESIMYNILDKNVVSPILKTGEKENLIIVEIVTNDVKFGLKDNKVNIDINMEVNISEVGKAISLESKEKVREVENILENEVKDRVEDFVRKYQIERGVQILGFENLYYRKKKEYPQNVEFNTNVDISIANQGGVVNIW